MQLNCVTKLSAALLTCAVLFSPVCLAEQPFFITYTHRLEEPGNLEIGTKMVTANPGAGTRFLGGALEFEYGVKAWWTTELYLDGQSTRLQDTLFTGFRWENRVRLLPREHWINPVLYVEFENINGADRALLEVVATDGKSDLAGPVSESRREKKRELEAKLILGSYYKGWTIAENFIVEKNVRHAPFEFGYAVGVSRPFALAARPDRCEICPENFQAGVEMYGGLGTHAGFGPRDASHYIAPTIAWTHSNGTTFKVSPGFGVTGVSQGFLLRFGVSYEVSQFGQMAHNLFRSKETKASADRDRQAGEKLYMRECAGCHERTGKPGKAPRLDRPEIAAASSEALLAILRNGRLWRGMPSFAHLPEQQREQIVKFLRSR